MAVLVAVLRGLKSQRAIWRLLAAGGWWKQPSYDIEDQAIYKRLEQEGWNPLAHLVLFSVIVTGKDTSHRSLVSNRCSFYMYIFFFIYLFYFSSFYFY